jgi:hypothetical protein
MLDSISWLQFTAFIVLALVIYYAYVLVVYYGRELRLFIARRWGMLPDAVDQFEQDGRMADPSGSPVNEAEEVVQFTPIEQLPAPPPAQQAGLFHQAGSKVDDDADIYRAADKAIGKVMAVLHAAKASPVSREEIEERLRSVLAGYVELRDTLHQEAINQIIQRACIHQFNLRLEVNTLERLWR